MEVILLSDVDKLGLRGELVNVSPGYMRNYLQPRKLAQIATPGIVAELRRRDAERARHEARSVDQAHSIADVLAKTVLRFEKKAGPSGVLFGSITPSEVVDELWRVRRVRVDRRKIHLTEPIKRVGRYDVRVEVFDDVHVDVKTIVAPVGGVLADEEPATEPVVTSAAGADAAPFVEPDWGERG